MQYYIDEFLCVFITNNDFITLVNILGTQKIMASEQVQIFQTSKRRHYFIAASIASGSYHEAK